MTTLAILAALVVIGLAAFVRLAPTDFALWHVDIGTDLPAEQGPCADHITAGRGAARAVCLLPEGFDTVLARLDAIATATPRTKRLTGDPASGRITWVTRSAVWGFPDYITAQTLRTPDGTRLEIIARLRFGGSDFGVNAARLRDWLAAL